MALVEVERPMVPEKPQVGYIDFRPHPVPHRFLKTKYRLTATSLLKFHFELSN